MKHIELNYPSLAEAYSKALGMLDVSDLGHATRITIDIDENSPYDDSWFEIPDTTERIFSKVRLEEEQK